MTIEIPGALAAAHLKYGGEAGAAWTAGLPALAGRYLDEWDLRPDGGPRHGIMALVQPVVRADGTKAVLKLQPVTPETVHEGLALRTWAGDGSVRLLDADAATGTMLLERLDGGRSLAAVPDVMEALDVLSGLLRRLVAHPAPEGVRRLDDIARAMLERAEQIAGKPVPDEERYWVGVCASAVADLVSGPAAVGGERLLHWDLHYDNVLAGEREPWLAIDPKPLAGDPAFELLPALHNRWDEVLATGDAPREVLRRFDFMVDALGLDRRRAAGWTLGRVLENLLWYLEDGHALNGVQVQVAMAMRARW
ncbi:aminoglycoside phosphotransferase family protein [Nonomuraea fuscirosea]|jgi:streptomycin 6-kinase|uniref:aminoglycoside phosphotransferase family protein n=1 Tax=Nonomuraea fuscirosea TaxID=1291556 RepID=UPI002DDA6532|nr:aminoglycoside phosphotransferase family protein [Nonomuraea fuscirosea]WSA51520.1 aminoglycoside phosphotransferase family protein [Nonomuraea fuscirosea]